MSPYSAGLQRNAAEQRWLFAELTEFVKRHSDGDASVEAMSEHPTFLPMLLAENVTSMDGLLERAFELRDSGGVRDYRQFLREARDDFYRGVRSANKKKTIRELAASLEAKFGPSEGVTMKMGVELGLDGPKATAGFEKKVSAAELGWLLSAFPGQRYRKLLTQMTAEQAQRAHLELRLEQLWSKT